MLTVEDSRADIPVDDSVPMHIFGIGLHVLIATFFAIHALRTGREMYWLFVLFAFPLLGSLVYAVVVWLPAARGTRVGRRVQRSALALLNPGRELREAQQALEATPSSGNHLRLADALLADGKAAEAVEHYAKAREGVQADDPEIEVRHAHALLDAGQAEAARDLLQALIQRRPDFRSPSGHLVFAQAVAASGERRAGAGSRGVRGADPGFCRVAGAGPVRRTADRMERVRRGRAPDRGIPEAGAADAQARP